MANHQLRAHGDKQSSRKNKVTKNIGQAHGRGSPNSKADAHRQLAVCSDVFWRHQRVGFVIFCLFSDGYKRITGKKYPQKLDRDPGC